MAVRWRGRSYASIGWFLGDYLMLFPLATDAQIAGEIDVAVQTVRHHRMQAGIGEYRERDPANPYATGPRRSGCGRVRAA